MFTGIIEDRGVITGIQKTSNAAKLSLRTALNTDEIKLGDSISVNGACITVTDISGDGLTFDVSLETLDLTNLKDLKSNDRVNVERALKVNGRLDGHIVSGHIDGLGTIAKKVNTGDFIKVRVKTERASLRYIVKKGSIAVDGISLTVNSVDASGFDFVIIPHTLKMTNLEFKNAGDSVNLETDILAKYVEKLVMLDDEKNKSKVSASFLREHGFM